MSNNTKRVGSQTIELKSKPRIIATYSVVGPREGQGPLKEYFDTHSCSFLIITHHTNILKKLTPNYVHIIENGKIIKTGDYSLAENIENNGFNRTNKVSENINNE